MRHVFLSLGSNLDREANIASALRKLEAKFACLEVSPVYESEAVGFDGSPFLNLVVGLETDYSLSVLTEELKLIEDQHGRQRSGPKFGPRTLDIDVITFGELVGSFDGIELPRPELYYNAFVLLPMADLVPDRIDPKTQLTYRDLWAQLKTSQKLWQVEFKLS